MEYALNGGENFFRGLLLEFRNVYDAIVKRFLTLSLMVLWSGGITCAFVCSTGRLLETNSSCCGSSKAACCEEIRGITPAAELVSLDRPGSTIHWSLEFSQVVLNLEIFERTLIVGKDGKTAWLPPPLTLSKHSLILAPPLS